MMSATILKCQSQRRLEQANLKEKTFSWVTRCQRNNRHFTASLGKADTQANGNSVSSFHYFSVFNNAFPIQLYLPLPWWLLKKHTERGSWSTTLPQLFSASLVTYPLNMNWIFWSNGQSVQHTTVSSMEVLLWIRQHIWGIQETGSAGKSDCLHCPTTCTDRWEIYKKPWVGAQKNLIAFCWCCSGPCRHQGDWQSWAQFYHAPTWKSSWISYSGAQAFEGEREKVTLGEESCKRRMALWQ